MKDVAIFYRKNVSRAHREETDPREEEMLSHPKLVVHEIPWNEADGNECSVVSVEYGREDDLLKSIVEITAKQKYFLSYINCIVAAAVERLLTS